MKYTFAMICTVTALTGACTLAPVNPFTDLDPIPLDGTPTPLEFEIVPLGTLEAGRVIRITVSAETPVIEAVLLLAEDESQAAGKLAGGGPADTAFDYRVPATDRYFVFAQFDPAVAAADRVATIQVEPGDATYTPPERQAVMLEFSTGFLTEPGLFDPESQSAEDRAFLDSISQTVRDGVVDRLREIFAGTPIDILDENDALPAGPFSTVTFSPERVLAEDPDATDAALPPADPTRPECQERVVFGEVLPRGTDLDPGNRVLDDKAIVYVGSFQGRGETCQSAALNSVNNIVLGLSQTAAHEIGHLLGLYHVPLTDIMDRSPTQAFQRELDFDRGQLLIDALGRDENGEPVISATVLTNVLQDPTFYFSSIFLAEN